MSKFCQAVGVYRRAMRCHNVVVFYPGQEVGVCEVFRDGVPVIKHTVIVKSVDEVNNLIEFEVDLPNDIMPGNFLVIE